MKLDAKELVTIIQKRHPDSLVYHVIIEGKHRIGPDTSTLTNQSIVIIPIEDIDQIGLLYYSDGFRPRVTNYIVNGKIVINKDNYNYHYEFADDDFADYFMEMRYLYTYLYENRDTNARHQILNFHRRFRMSNRDILLELLDEYENSLPVFEQFEKFSQFNILQDHEDFVALTKFWDNIKFVRRIVKIANKNHQNPIDDYRKTMHVDGTIVTKTRHIGFPRGTIMQITKFELPTAELVDYFIENLTMATINTIRPVKAAFA